LASKDHYPAKFRSLFGDVPVRVRRLLVCPCQGPAEAKSFAVLDPGKDAVAPELAYVTARYAALAPFGKVAQQAARGLGAGTADTHLADEAVRGLKRAKWRLWHERWSGCRRKLVALCRWTERKHMRDVASIGPFSGTQATCWATSNATRTPWCTTLPGVGVVSRSRPHSWRARSTRS